MKQWALCAVAAMGLIGCGVSKEIYQSELVRGQGLEARAADLDARLQAETTKRHEAEEGLAACGQRAASLEAAVTRSEARGSDLESQLAASLGREGELRASLDLARKTRTAAEAEREETRKTLQEREQEAATLRAQVDELGAERDRLAREKREEIDQISGTYEGLLEGMKDEVAKGRVTISQLRGQLSVNVLDEILFDSGSSEVKAQGRELLNHVGEVLRGMADKAIVIEGHTDAVPISGELAKRFPTNWELSTARATSVVRHLQEAAGIEPDRLSAVGYGPYRPVTTNDAPEGRAKNRRIEIKLVPREPRKPPRLAVSTALFFRSRQCGCGWRLPRAGQRSCRRRCCQFDRPAEWRPGPRRRARRRGRSRRDSWRRTWG